MTVSVSSQKATTPVNSGLMLMSDAVLVALAVPLGVRSDYILAGGEHCAC
jgi:hypothetical protein